MGEVEHEFGTLNSSIVFIIIINAASVPVPRQLYCLSAFLGHPGRKQLSQTASGWTTLSHEGGNVDTSSFGINTYTPGNFNGYMAQLLQWLCLVLLVLSVVRRPRQRQGPAKPKLRFGDGPAPEGGLF